MSNTLTNLDRLAAQHAQNIIFYLVDKDEKGNERNDKKQINDAAKKSENTVTKALGVLQENGVYACFLYLLAKEKDNGKSVVAEMLDLLEKLDFGWKKPNIGCDWPMSNEQVDIRSEILLKNLRPEIVLKHITDNVTQNLERLLLTKEILEQMLIYARYGAKARQEETSTSSNSNNQQEENH
jgi:hypothetical protein